MSQKTVKHAARFRAPTVVEVHDYNQELYLAHRRGGLHHESGPRFGQQLAARRAAGKA